MRMCKCENMQKRESENMRICKYANKNYKLKFLESLRGWAYGETNRYLELERVTGNRSLSN